MFIFVIDKIVSDRVMSRFELCCTVFALQLSSLSELVGVTHPKPSLLLLLPLPTGNVIYSCFLQGSTFGYLVLNCSCSLASFSSDSFVQTKAGYVPLPSLHLCIMLMFAGIFIFTSSTELQMSLSLSFSGCECHERI